MWAKKVRRAGRGPGLCLPIDVERLVRVSEAVHHAWSKALGEDVSLANHVEKDRPIGIIFEVEDDALLASIDKLK